MPPMEPAPLQYRSKQPAKTTPAKKQSAPAATKPAPQKKEEKTAPPPPPPADQTRDGDVPPPPENFAEDWDMEWQPSFDDAAIAAKPAPKFVPEEPVTPPQTARPSVESRAEPQPEPAPEAPPLLSARSLYVPLAREEPDHPPKQITITLRATANREWDRRRIKTLHGTLISFHGRDKFSFQIFENGRGHLIDFPNESTRIGPDLLARLHKVLGEECWRVEDIMLQ